MQIVCRTRFSHKMKRIIRIAYALVLTTILASCQEKDRYITITGFAQGGTYAVKLNLKGVTATPEEIRDNVQGLLENIDRSLSGYNRNSLLSGFNSGSAITPDSLFFDIYSHAWNIWADTKGIVDVASAPLFELWGFGFKSGEMPDEATVAETMKNSGMHRLCQDMKSAISPDGTLTGTDLLAESGKAPQLNYNAIAQGYSCDVVARYLYSIGAKDMMVDIGEIYCDGRNPSGGAWSLGIDKPVDGNNELGAQLQGIFRVPEGPHGIVTSGNYRKFYVKDGKKYAHTIDPRTGYPVAHNLLSTTIIASDATTADAYATYCMVIGLEESIVFLKSRQDLEGCLIYDEDGEFKTWCSSGFKLEDPQ